MTTLKKIAIMLALLILLLGVGFALIFHIISGEQRREDVENLVGGSHFLFHDAEVIDVISEDALVVRVIDYRWIEDSDNTPLLEGDIIKVIWEDNDFIADIITEMIEIGTRITFTRPNSGFETNFSQNPPVVPATGIAVYDENGEEIIDRTPF